MKKILVETGQGANFFIRQSLVNAWRSVGYEVYFWNSEGKSPFDVFAEFEPDLFLSSVWQLNRATVKCLGQRKHCKIILYADMLGDIQKDLDLIKYPVGITTEEQIKIVEDLIVKNTQYVNLITNHGPKNVQYTHGNWKNLLGLEVNSVLVSADLTNYFHQDPDEVYKVNIAYVGGYWPFKGRNLNQYILPLTYPTTKWSVRLFGSGWNTVNGLGQISDREAAKFYRNAMVVPHVVEPHCSDLYQDLPLRYFQVPACYGFAVSCPCVGIRDVFTEDELVVAESPSDFFDKVVHYLNNPEETIPFRQKAMEKVYGNHTGLHRIKQLHSIIGEDTEIIDRGIAQFHFDLTGY